MEIKVKNHEDLVRDSATGAILASDNSELLKYRQRKAAILREQDRDREVSSLKADIEILKAMIADMSQKLSNTK